MELINVQRESNFLNEYMEKSIFLMDYSTKVR